MPLNTEQRHIMRSVLMNELGLTRDLIRSEARHLIMDVVKQEMAHATHVGIIEDRMQKAMDDCVKGYLTSDRIANAAGMQIREAVQVELGKATRDNSVLDFLSSKCNSVRQPKTATRSVGESLDGLGHTSPNLKGLHKDAELAIDALNRVIASEFSGYAGLGADTIYGELAVRVALELVRSKEQ